MAEQSFRNCSSCGEVATTKCGGCKLKPYCSKECQSKEWPEHKTTCQDERLHQILLRAAGIVQAVFLKFRELTLEKRIAKVEINDEELIIHEAPFTLELFPGFKNTLLPEKIKASVLCDLVCLDAMAFMHHFVSLLLKDLPVTIKEVEVALKNIPRQTTLMCSNGEIRTNWPGYSHEMWLLTSTKSGKTWYLDVTGAQYGIHKTLWVAKEFDSLYLQKIRAFFEPGTGEQLIKMRGLTSGRRKALTHQKCFEAVAHMDKATIGWAKKHKMRLSALLKLDSQEFEVEKAELLEVIRLAVSDFVTNTDCSEELMEIAAANFLSDRIEFRTLPKGATLADVQRLDPDAHHIIIS